MKVGQAKTREVLEALAAKWSNAELIGQQMFTAGVVTGLNDLIDTGFSEERARKMLGEARRNMDLLNEIAKPRGVMFKLE